MAIRDLGKVATGVRKIAGNEKRTFPAAIVASPANTRRRGEVP